MRGASHPEELVEQAVTYEYTAIAITDWNTFAGIVRADAAAKKTGLRIIVGCRLDLLDGLSLLAYPADKTSYSQLSNLLTVGNGRAKKGECHLYKADVYKYARGVKFVALPPDKLNEAFEFVPSFENILEEYQKAFRNDLYIAASRRYLGDDSKFLFRLMQLRIN